MSSRRRGAMRSESARVAILQATASVLAERGWNQLTIEGIAASAGVGKPTIYRWWPSKSALIAEALSDGMLPPALPVPGDTGDLRADLALWLDETLAQCADPGSTSLFRSLIAAAAEDESVAASLARANPAPQALAERLRTAGQRGEIPSESPHEPLVDALFGTVVLRTMRRAPHAPGDAEALVDALLGTVTDPSPPPRGAGLHHLELWTADLAAEAPAWDWLLSALGWRGEEDLTWEDGRIWRHPDGSYLVLEQSPDVVGASAERRRPGMNHVAFSLPATGEAAGRAELDTVRENARAHGWTELFAERYPHAGGEEQLAWYAHSSEGVEVEVVVDVR